MKSDDTKGLSINDAARASHGPGIAFAPGQWKSAADKGIGLDKDKFPVAADPLIYIEDMPQSWRDKGVTDMWGDLTQSHFVGPLSLLNWQLKEKGLPPHDPGAIADKNAGASHQKGLDHHQAKPITFDGRTMTRKEWADELGIHSTTLLERLKKYPLEEALTRPKRVPSHSKQLTYKGITKTYKAWADELGIALSSFRSRMQRHPNNMEKIMQSPQLAKGRGRA